MSDDTWMDASIDELRILYADRLKDLKYEYEVRCAYESAVQTARLNNPYSITAFTPVGDDDWRRLASVVEKEMGHSFDRYAAALMVDAWDGCARTIEEMATKSIAAQ